MSLRKIIKSGNFEFVEWIITEYDVDITRIFIDLFWNEHVHSVIRLIKFVDVNRQSTSDGNTILMDSIFYGQSDELVLLSIDRIQLNLFNFDGFTLLMIACMFHKNKVVEMLLERGADVNMRCRHGLTALKYSILNENSTAKRLLIA